MPAHSADTAPTQHYVLSVGSNVPHHHHGAPRHVIAAAALQLNETGISIVARSTTMFFAPLGPSRRRFANAAWIVATSLDPDELLGTLKALEIGFGRRPGQRWGARVIDLDIILWSGGFWRDRTLSVPHPAWQLRDFVLEPMVRVAPDWRDPASGLAVRHIAARIRRPNPANCD